MFAQTSRKLAAQGFWTDDHRALVINHEKFCQKTFEQISLKL